MDVLLDLFPANATVGDLTYRKVRVVATADGVAAVFGGTGALLLVARSVGVSTAASESLVGLADGSAWTVTPAAGCGCGSGVRGWSAERLIAAAVDALAPAAG